MQKIKEALEIAVWRHEDDQQAYQLHPENYQMCKCRGKEMTEKLKACPFCGGEAELMLEGTQPDVSCIGDCGMSHSIQVSDHFTQDERYNNPEFQWKDRPDYHYGVGGMKRAKDVLTEFWNTRTEDSPDEEEMSWRDRAESYRESVNELAIRVAKAEASLAEAVTNEKWITNCEQAKEIARLNSHITKLDNKIAARSPPSPQITDEVREAVEKLRLPDALKKDAMGDSFKIGGVCGYNNAIDHVLNIINPSLKGEKS